MLKKKKNQQKTLKGSNHVLHTIKSRKSFGQLFVWNSSGQIFIWNLKPCSQSPCNLFLSAKDVTCLDIKHVSNGSVLVFWSISSEAGASANIITQLMWHCDNPVLHCLHLLLIFIRPIKLVFSICQHCLMWSINTAKRDVLHYAVAYQLMNHLNLQ